MASNMIAPFPKLIFKVGAGTYNIYNKIQYQIKDKIKQGRLKSQEIQLYTTNQVKKDMDIGKNKRTWWIYEKKRRLISSDKQEWVHTYETNMPLFTKQKLTERTRKYPFGRQMWRKKNKDLWTSRNSGS